jgi:hypothetical protein
MTRSNKIIIGVSSFVLLTIFLFSKAATSKKIEIGENEYSVYSESYVYAELLCVFSFMDCNRAGVIYLYDEVEGEVLESVATKRVKAVESVSWLPYPNGNSIYFRAYDDIEIENNEWTLPRPLKKSKQ